MHFDISSRLRFIDLILSIFLQKDKILKSYSCNKNVKHLYLCRSCHAFVIQAFPISVLVILGKFS